jgi:hypothetical protein
MAGFSFRCPFAAVHVHAWTEAENFESNHYETVTCAACQRVHLVNPKTGHVIGHVEKE